jgi:transposase
MPWKASAVMEERLRFVARLIEGEPMTEVCRAFGISHKTGDKLFERSREEGATALADRSRRLTRSHGRRTASARLGSIPRSTAVSAKR